MISISIEGDEVLGRLEAGCSLSETISASSAVLVVIGEEEWELYEVVRFGIRGRLRKGMRFSIVFCNCQLVSSCSVSVGSSIPVLSGCSFPAREGRGLLTGW